MNSVVIALGVTRPSSSATVVIDVENVARVMFDADVMIAEELPTSSHVPYISNALPVRKRGNSSTKAKPRKIRHLNISTESEAAVLKEKDVLNVLQAAKLSYLSSEAVAAEEALLRATKTVNCVSTKDFLNLYEMNELLSSKNQAKSDGLLLW